MADIPSRSRWVSTIAGVQAAWPADAQDANFFLGASIINSTNGIHYSGGTVAVDVQITPVNGDDIVRITSISITNPGFSVVGVSPSLPTTVTANNNTVTTHLIVTVMLPSSSVSVGTLTLSLSTF